MIRRGKVGCRPAGRPQGEPAAHRCNRGGRRQNKPGRDSSLCRVRLFSACRALRRLAAAPDAPFFAAVRPAPASPAAAAQAARWLAAHKPAVRELQLLEPAAGLAADAGVHTALGGALRRLAGGPLAALRWEVGASAALTLGDLRLPRLRRLALVRVAEGVRSEAAPLKLAFSLSRLAALEQLALAGWGSVALEPRCLPPTLSSLCLAGCYQRDIPAPLLAAAGQLRALRLSLRGPPGGLQRLSALRRLWLGLGARQDAPGLPAQLAALQGLEALTLADASIWDLGQLPLALTELRLLRGTVSRPRREPLPLLALSRLTRLHTLVLARVTVLARDDGVGDATEQGGLGPALAALGQLRQLVLSNNGSWLATPPPQASGGVLVLGMGYLWPSLRYSEALWGSGCGVAAPCTASLLAVCLPAHRSASCLH